MKARKHSEEAKYVSVNSNYLFMEDRRRWNNINFRKTTLIYEITLYKCKKLNISLNKLYHETEFNKKDIKTSCSCLTQEHDVEFFSEHRNSLNILPKCLYLMIL